MNHVLFGITVQKRGLDIVPFKEYSNQQPPPPSRVLRDVLNSNRILLTLDLFTPITSCLLNLYNSIAFIAFEYIIAADQ
jgi:hypothetical protein